MGPVGIEVKKTVDGGYQIACKDSNLYLMNASNIPELKAKIDAYIGWITEDPRHYDPEKYLDVPRFDEVCRRMASS